MSIQRTATHAQAESAPAVKDRRKTHRSDRAFQNRFRLAMLQLVAVAVVPLALLSLGVSHTLRNPHVFLNSLWAPILLTVAGIAAGVLIVRRCDKVSNRYCGPTVRIIGTLEAIRRGERPTPVQVREDDEFEHLVKQLNETFEHLGLMDDSVR